MFCAIFNFQTRSSKKCIINYASHRTSDLVQYKG